MTSPEGKTVATTFRAPGTVDWRELVVDDAADKAKEEEARKAKEEEARKAKDELKNVLLASLQMQNLVVLAGSGCSRSAGGPSMQDLWNGAVGQKPTDAAKTTAEKVNHNLDVQNIEAFLSRVEAFLQVNQDEGVSDFLHSSKQVILDKCSALLDPQKLELYRPQLIGH